MNVPVVFIHLNESQYVLDVFKASLNHNETYVISNIDYSKYIAGVKSVNISTLESGLSKEFSKSYKHLHSGPYFHELFCYQRWFYLFSFMKYHKLEKILHLDSDVIINTNASEDHKRYDQYIMTLAHGSSGATSYITIDGISLFVDMLMDIYSTESYCLDILECQFNTMQKYNKPGGICDMTLLNMFREKPDYGGGPNRVGEMMQIIDGCTHDHNINVNDSDYAMSNNIKDIQIENQSILCLNKRLDKHIEFKSLHCQGMAKQHIHSIYKKLCK